MAIGALTAYNDGETTAIELLASATATNSPPSGAAAGLAVSEIRNIYNFMPAEMELQLNSTAGSGTMTVSGRLWGYTPASSGKWMPLGTGADATKGMINEGQAIGETISDGIRHCEIICGIGRFERLYLEITAIGGTSTAVTAQLVVRRGSRS